MNTQQIKNAHLLDILFDGRNKSYGAYELRTNYNRRISLALLLVLVVAGILLSLSKFIKQEAIMEKISFTVHDVHPTVYNEPKKKPVMETGKTSVTKIDSRKYSRIKIVQDNHVHELPPTMSELENSNIELRRIDGEKNLTVTPPSEPVNSAGVVTGDNDQKNNAKNFIPLEKDASFPRGDQAWMKYIQQALMNRLDEFNEADFGTCIVKFAVDAEGKVSDVRAITMQNSRLAEIAVNAIRKGPRWIPAQQNGSYVTAYRIQPVTLLNPDK